MNFSFAFSQSIGFQWAKEFALVGGNSSVRPSAIATDANGNVYTTGAFGDSADFDPGPAVFAMQSNGSQDIFISKLDANGNFVWAKRTGGDANASAFDEGKSVLVDNAGNLYVVGRFVDTSDFDPGPGTYNLTAAGSTDIFVLKLNAAGNFVWAKQLGGAQLDYGLGVAVDGAGNVYTVGTFCEDGDFDPGPGTFPLTAAQFDCNTFLSKLDANGNFAWAIQFGAWGTQVARSVAVDAGGNVFIAGEFEGTVDFDPGPATFNMTNLSGNRDAFVAKLNGAGNFVWARQMGGGDDAEVYSMVLDAAGNPYLTGSFVGTVDFDPTPATFNLVGFGQNDAFVCKLDAAGNFRWAAQLGGTAHDFGHSIDVDPAGNAYITGVFHTTADFDPGAGVYNLSSVGQDDIFLCKLSTSGNFIWAAGMGGIREDIAYGIALDALGDVYSTGKFADSVDFDPFGGTHFLAAGTNGPFILSHGYVQKLNQEGFVGRDTGTAPGVRVYPNPSAGSCTVDLGQRREHVTLQLYDLHGRMLMARTYTDTQSISLDLDVPAGTYFLRLWTDEGDFVILATINRP